MASLCHWSSLYKLEALRLRSRPSAWKSRSRFEWIELGALHVAMAAPVQHSFNYCCSAAGEGDE